MRHDRFSELRQRELETVGECVTAYRSDASVQESGICRLSRRNRALEAVL